LGSAQIVNVDWQVKVFMSNKLKHTLIITLLAFSLGCGWWLNQLTNNQESKSNQPNTTAKLQIYTSFYPLYFFTQAITGEQAQVTNLTQAGVEPHDFEPSTQDLLKLSQADLVIGNGLNFETWLEKFKENIPQEKLLLASHNITEELLEINRVAEAENHQEQVDHDDTHVGTDPHVWLDPTLAAIQVQEISDKLQVIDPNNALIYQSNTKNILDKLESLDQAFQQGLLNCAQTHIVTTHQAFAYLAKRYNFEQLSILGLNPDEEPSPAAIVKLIQLVKDYGITHIFFETNLSPKLAETIAQEVGASTLVFHPLENLTIAEQQAGDDYFSIQTRNLSNLRQALHCQ
jgi:zinc transport system substrate-binding protein